MRCSAEYSRRKQRIDPLAEVSGESGSLRSAEHAGIAAATKAAHPRRRATERSAATIRTPNESIADLLSLRSGRTWQALDGTGARSQRSPVWIEARTSRWRPDRDYPLAGGIGFGTSAGIEIPRIANAIGKAAAQRNAMNQNARGPNAR